ncbi:MAG: hypothetical protein M1838_003538 [Thelocarpon superellum]|nr:MAG: hypothetical protein M1838_003538 [Thelocarpon superellum]
MEDVVEDGVSESVTVRPSTEPQSRPAKRSRTGSPEPLRQKQQRSGSVERPCLATPEARPEEANRASQSISQLLGNSSSAMVLCAVGPERTTWSLHQVVLEYHSPLLQATFRDEVAADRRAEPRELVLAQVDPDAFANFVDWMYAGGRVKLKFLMAEIQRVFGLLHIAVHLQVQRLETLISGAFEAFFRAQASWPTTAMMNQVYAISPPSSRIQLFCARCICYRLLVNEEAASTVFEGEERPDVALVRQFTQLMAQYGKHGKNLDDPRRRQVLP